MKPVKQTRMGKDDGNCFNACVASMLELPLERVDCVLKDGTWLEQINDVIHPLGYCYVAWPFESPWIWVGECYMIATGMGPRGCKHAIIVRHIVEEDGHHFVQNVFDPHPSDAFLDKIEYVGVLFPHMLGTQEGDSPCALN